MDRAEADALIVEIEPLLAAGEGLVRLRSDLVRQVARRDRHGSVHLATLVLLLAHREGEHRRQDRVARRVVHVEARHQATTDLIKGLAEELGVAARAVAVGHDVLHHQYVLVLGDHRLEVARVVA